MSAVVASGLSFTYPGADEPAIRDLSLAVRPGEITWLFGALGAGCTTFLLLAGGLAPRVTGGKREGTLTVVGQDPGEASGARALAGRIAFVNAAPRVQLSGVSGTVRREVAFAPANLGWPRPRLEAAVDRALADLGVEHLAHREPESLSGGELQRVVLASMAVLDPEAWLLDEPAAELDPDGRDRLYGVLRREAARGAAVVVASEDADALAPVADRCVVLAGGKVGLDGPPGDILRDERVWDLGAGSTTVATLARASRALHEAPELAPPYPLSVEEGIARWRRARS